MSGVNTNINLVGTDFDEIKLNLVNYFQDQEVLKDANYAGSVLSILMDLLAYNTHYNAFYLNMVGNEAFLDTAIKRSSVVSKAKMLGYTPSSASCPTAVVNLEFTGVESSYVYVPRFTKFLSEKVDGTNYSFVTIEEYLAATDGSGNATIENVVLKEGQIVDYSYVHNYVSNPFAKYTIPEQNIDIDTLEVIIQNSSSDIESTVYNRSEDLLSLGPSSEVYFLQESTSGYYEIYFGNGILGKKLKGGNIIKLKYLATSSESSNEASSFALVDPIVSTPPTITTVSSATLGGGRESIESIREIAPKSYSAQGRAVTVDDYKTQIKKSTKFPVDSVNVWSGDDNVPPVFGKVFISIKPKGGYSITENQKKLIIQSIVKPINVVTITPEIVDVDYTFLVVESNVLVNKAKTNLSEGQMITGLTNKIKQYSANNLNSFDSSLVVPDLIVNINEYDKSIITNEQKIRLQKRFTPTTNTSITYTVDFGIPIKRDFFGKSVLVSDSFQMLDTNNVGTSGGFVLRQDVYIEEVPAASTTIDSIVVLNSGINYEQTPTIRIVGDGKNANAYAVMLNGKIKEIIVDNPGQGYTQAIVEIVAQPGDGGSLGKAKVILQGRYGDLRTFYYNDGIKYILNPIAGTVDYLTGIVTLTNFKPFSINNNSGLVKINVVPDTNIISSTRNKLLTLDQNDPKAISINVLYK